MTKEIERAGIPVVHVTNLTEISKGIGSHRILRGNSVLHVFGNPGLPHEQEEKYRENHLAKALNMLEVKPEAGQNSIVED